MKPEFIGNEQDVGMQSQTVNQKSDQGHTSLVYHAQYRPHETLAHTAQINRPVPKNRMAGYKHSKL